VKKRWFMGSLSILRNIAVDGDYSVGQRMRQQRWELLRSTFPDIESMSVVDLGGTVDAWLRAPVRPASVHVINLEPDLATVPWIQFDQADACELPARIADRHYDLVFSNSVIEHVGGHMQRIRFAETSHKLADRHWVQTPYRYFPVEPHWLFPGFQFLPLRLRCEISQRWPLAHMKSTSADDGKREAMSIELLSCTEMSYYFPDSQLRFERFLGLVKSLVVTKTV
jgi:hypothetical protein